MKTKTKLFTTIVTILLSIAILFGFAFSTQMNRIDSLSAETIRTVDSENLNNRTLEDVTDQLLSQYDSYDCKVYEDSGEIVVNAETIIDGGLLSSLNFVSTYDEPVTKKYKTVIDQQTLDLKVEINYYQCEELIKSESEVVTPYYDEATNDYFFDIDGEAISVSKTVLADNIDYCIVGVDDVAIAITACAAVIVAYPIIEKCVTTIVTNVVNWVRSWWSWFVGLFVTTTVTTTVVTNVVKYQINVFGRTFKLTEVGEKEKEQPREPEFYFLATILDGKVFISDESITEAEAIATLATNPKTLIDKNECYLNTYTFFESMAQNIAELAAAELGYIGAWYHSAHGNNSKGVFFDHYHPGSKDAHGSGHSFYGVPVIRT